MKSEPNFFRNIKSSNSSSINSELKNIQQNPYYFCERCFEKEKRKGYMEKKEIENEKDKKIDDFFTKDIIDSMSFNQNSSQNSPNKKALTETSIQNKKQMFEDEKESFSQKPDIYKEYILDNNNKICEQRPCKNYVYRRIVYIKFSFFQLFIFIFWIKNWSYVYRYYYSMISTKDYFSFWFIFNSSFFI